MKEDLKVEYLFRTVRSPSLKKKGKNVPRKLLVDILTSYFVGYYSYQMSRTLLASLHQSHILSTNLKLALLLYFQLCNLKKIIIIFRITP